MPGGNLVKRIMTACVSSVTSGMDYIKYLTQEFLNSGKDDGWPIGELAKIEPMPAEPTHAHNTSSGKINLRMMDND